MNYIIISPKHGDGIKPVFWRPNAAGYTESPFAAGIYTQEQISSDPEYYNDGYNAVAIPLTDSAMDELGFSCSYSSDKLKKFFPTKKESARGIRVA